MLQHVHHVHYVVQDRDAMVKYLEQTFGLKPDDLREDRHHGKVAHYNIGKTQIQIASPTDPASGIGKYLAAHGPGVFHVAWAVGDVRKVAQELVAKGIKMKENESIVENSLGSLVCNIDVASSQGILFQLVGSE